MAHKRVRRCGGASKPLRHSTELRNIDKHLIGLSSALGCHHSHFVQVCYTIACHVQSYRRCIHSLHVPGIPIVPITVTTASDTMPSHFVLLSNKMTCLKELYICHDILSHFCEVQNLLQIAESFKIIVY